MGVSWRTENDWKYYGKRVKIGATGRIRTNSPFKEPYFSERDTENYDAGDIVEYASLGNFHYATTSSQAQAVNNGNNVWTTQYLTMNDMRSQWTEALQRMAATSRPPAGWFDGGFTIMDNTSD